MGTPGDRQPISFANEGGRIGFQAGHLNVYGNNIVQHAHDPLERLPCAAEAPFNAYAKQHEHTCLRNTRVNLLREIYSWASGRDERHIFWMSGLAGTGKSTIARTVARNYYTQQRLGASFFFSRGGGDVSHAGRFVTSLAVQLAHNIPIFRQHICDAIAERSDIASQSLRDQWHHLILCPLSKLGGTSSYVLVVDALDECNDDNDIRMIVQLLAEARSLRSVRLRVFLTSRPEVPIRHGFGQVPDAEHQDFVLHSISPSIIDNDIKLFLEYNLQLIASECCQAADWPGEEVIRRLVQSASGLFIWAATACRFIREGGQFVADRLHVILNDSSPTDGLPANGSSAEDSCMDEPSAILPEKRLNSIYLTVLNNPIRKYRKSEKEIWYRLVRETLGTIVLLFSPLSVSSLAGLLCVSVENVHRMLYELHSILDAPQDTTRFVRLHHPSFRDFLLDKERCGDAKLWVDEKQAHYALADNCIKLMSSSLKRDICDTNDPGAPAIGMKRDRLEQCLPLELQYACLYWIQHLQKSGVRLSDNNNNNNNNNVHDFLKEHFLHWLEALGWMGKVSEGIHAINSLESIVVASDCPDLYAFVHDMKRFALYSRSAIEEAPLQAYYSALVFAPERSKVKRQFIKELGRLERRFSRIEDWGALLQTLEAHLDEVTAVAFSPGGKVLASASRDKTIKLWDAGTGTELQMLEGHSDDVSGVAFSPDGKVLASGSWDKMVKLWDAGTGAELQTFEGHANHVSGVAFSPDGRMLASGSWDETVKLWDASTGAELQTLEAHLGEVNSVAFSPDGKVLASGSRDGTVKLWDTGTGAELQTLEGHSGDVKGVAFSPDGKMLASASWDETVKLWDAGTGDELQTLEGHSDEVTAVAFSPDSKVLASASDDETVTLWDTSTGAELQTLEGHSYNVSGVAFLPDGKMLASGSWDNTVKLWDAGTDAELQTLEGHSGEVNSVAFSPDGKVLASASEDNTIKLWDTSTNVELQTLEGHSGNVITVAFSPDGKVLASGSEDFTVKLWDAGTGAELQTLEGYPGDVYAVAFSPDSMVLASASKDKTIKLWDIGTGTELRMLEGHSGNVCAVSFSPDSTMLASGSGDKTVKLWDACTGAELQMLEGHSDDVSIVAFSPDSKALASASGDRTVKLWDTSTGAVLQSLYVGVLLDSLSFSNNGSLLETNRGTLHTSLSCAENPYQPSQLTKTFVNGQWVNYRSKNLLWLPRDHRPDCMAVHKDILALGYMSGRLLMFELAF